MLALALLVLVGASAGVLNGVVRTGGESAPTGAEKSVRVSPAAPSGRPTASRDRPLGSGRPVTLAFGGDVHFEGVLRSKLLTEPRSVLAPIAPVLRRADVAMLNLESAVTTRGTPAPRKAFHFRAPPQAFAALRAGGVDVVTMANNHGMDYGERGLRDSLAAARRYRFPVVGIGLNGRRAYAPYRMTIEGQRIAIIGATQVIDDWLIRSWTAGPGKPGLASAKTVPRLLRAVRQARRSADTVVVYLHWGMELVGCPTAAQTAIARRVVAAGADVLVGSHAHRLLGAGMLRRALVAYGLGNFAFYSSSGYGIETGVLRITVTGRRVNRYSWVPARISSGSPYPLGGAARSRAIASWRSLRSCTNLRPLTHRGAATRH